MTETVERIDLAGLRATVLSRQRFVRVVRLPDAAERRRISTALHRRRMEKRADTWVEIPPLEELEQRAWWEDEGEPKP